MLHLLANFSMFTFIVSSLLGAGLGLTVAEIIAPLKRVKLDLYALLANFIIIPAATYLIAYLLKVDPGLKAGLTIMAGCAGAPFLPKLVTVAKGKIAGAIGLMMLLMLVTVIYLPLVLPLLITGLAIKPVAIAKPLIFYLLLPLATGLMIKAYLANLAAKAKPIIERLSSLSLILAGILTLITSYQLFISAWGTGVYNALTIFTLISMIIGYLFGGNHPAEKIVSTLGCGARNIAAALLIAATNFSDPRVSTVVLIGSLIQFVILFLTAFIWGKVNKEVF
jgi:BASS family bile acid:Na+ symporter